ncbi:MAG: NYN domain-containing protein [bacterium]
MNKKAFIFIDGSNLYFKLKEFRKKLNKDLRLLNFNFRKFSEFLAGENEVVEIHYYIGAVKRQEGNQKSEKMYSDQQKLLGKLQQQKVITTMGVLIRHPDKTYHEKGVDVRLAVEMIRFARQNKYDIAYLLSSDTDLVPAIEEVQAFGKAVQYVGFTKAQSFGLTVIANDIKLLRPEDIEQFFEN